MTVLARFSKAAGALAGSLLAVLVAFGVDLTPAQTGALVPFLSGLATILAPANRDPADDISWHFNEHGEPVRD